MTLEAVIQENTATLRELINVMTAGQYREQKAIHSEPDAEKTADKVIESAKENLAAQGKKASSGTAKTSPASSVPSDTGASAEPLNTKTKSWNRYSTLPSEAGASAEPLSYMKHVKPKAVALINIKGNDALKAVLEQFGLAKAPDAKPEQFAELVQALDLELAAA